MDALLFDFDGVIVDSEPIHLRCFRASLDPLGVTLTGREYYAEYVGFDDHDCFAAVLQANGRDWTETLISELIDRKSELLQEAYRSEIAALPGAVELIAAARDAGVPRAICSGALREEIEMASQNVGVREFFPVIVAARDVSHGKPDPEGYAKTLRLLSEAVGKPLEPGRTIVLEDSRAGVQAGKAAGMKALAVTNSYPADALDQADRVVDTLEGLTLAQLDALL